MTIVACHKQFEVMSPTALLKTAADLRVFTARASNHTLLSGGTFEHELLYVLTAEKIQLANQVVAVKCLAECTVRTLDGLPSLVKPANINMSKSLCAKLISSVVFFHAH